MSDDDRDIDIESDVSILFSIFRVTKINKKKFFSIYRQDENDSDTRSQNRTSTNGTQFFSQVNKYIRKS